MWGNCWWLRVPRQRWGSGRPQQERGAPRSSAAMLHPQEKPDPPTPWGGPWLLSSEPQARTGCAAGALPPGIGSSTREEPGRRELGGRRPQGARAGGRRVPGRRGGAERGGAGAAGGGASPRQEPPPSPCAPVRWRGCRGSGGRSSSPAPVRRRRLRALRPGPAPPPSPGRVPRPPRARTGSRAPPGASPPPQPGTPPLEPPPPPPPPPRRALGPQSGWRLRGWDPGWVTPPGLHQPSARSHLHLPGPSPASPSPGLPPLPSLPSPGHPHPHPCPPSPRPRPHLLSMLPLPSSPPQTSPSSPSSTSPSASPHLPIRIPIASLHAHPILAAPQHHPTSLPYRSPPALPQVPRCPHPGSILTPLPTPIPSCASQCLPQPPSCSKPPFLFHQTHPPPLRLRQPPRVPFAATPPHACRAHCGKPLPRQSCCPPPRPPPACRSTPPPRGPPALCLPACQPQPPHPPGARRAHCTSAPSRRARSRAAPPDGALAVSGSRLRARGAPSWPTATGEGTGAQPLFRACDSAPHRPGGRTPPTHRGRRCPQRCHSALGPSARWRLCGGQWQRAPW